MTKRHQSGIFFVHGEWYGIIFMILEQRSEVRIIICFAFIRADNAHYERRQIVFDASGQKMGNHYEIYTQKSDADLVSGIFLFIYIVESH